MAFNDTLIRLIGAKPLIGGLNGGLQPLNQPLSHCKSGRFDIFTTVEMVQEFGELPLRIPLGTLYGKPLLHTLLLPGVKINLIADVENDVPAVLITLADASSH